MPKILGSVIREQGVVFAVVQVKHEVFLQPTRDRDQLCLELQRYFPGMPIALMAEDDFGEIQFWGRPDIVRFLQHVHPSRIPWKEYTFS